MPTRTRLWLAAVAVLAHAALGAPQARAGFSIDTAANYVDLFEGGGNNTLQITNVTIYGNDGNNGNVGVGGSGKATDSGPSTINGGISFSAADTGQFTNNNSKDVITGGVTYKQDAVTSALSYLNGLNTKLGAETGKTININLSGTQTYTINASDGVLDASGNRVFTVTGFNTTDGNTLIINGDAAGDSVVLNFTQTVNFNNQVVLNGLNPDQVLYNFVGGSNLSGGPTLQINDNASSSSKNLVQGDFLDPNGPISVTNTNLLGRIFGGDSHDMQIVSGDTIRMPTPAGVAPEPSPLCLFGIGGLSLIGFTAVRHLRRPPSAA